MVVNPTSIGEDIASLRRALECSPFGIIMCNRWLRVVLINGAAREITGMEGKEVVGRRISGILPYSVVREFIDSARERQKRSYLDVFSSLETGDDVLSLRVVASAICDEHGGFMGAVVFLDTLDELREISRKVIRSERISAIKETAISLNHEINNPLCSILGNTQLILMERDKLDPVVVEKLERIERDIARIHDIAEKLTRITKPVIGEYVGGTRMIDVEKSSV